MSPQISHYSTVTKSLSREDYSRRKVNLLFDINITDKNLDLNYEKDVLIQKLNNLIDIKGEIDHPIYGKMESEKIKFLIIHHTTHHFNQFDLIK